jgi:hypothetical protein
MSIILALRGARFGASQALGRVVRYMPQFYDAHPDGAEVYRQARGEALRYCIFIQLAAAKRLIP